MRKNLIPKILVTGVSGTLGTELVRELWQNNYRNIISSGRTNKQPIPEVHLPFVKLDLSEENLGINNSKELWQDVEYIIHCAADVRWNLPLEKATQANTQATNILMQQAKQYAPNLKRFIYISTAFVDSAKLSRSESECELFSLNNFNNTYEYSKFLTEQKLLNSGLPWTVIRPSIIIGRQDTGQIDRFLSIYQILKLYQQELLPLLVGYEDAVLDLVPVDVVTSSIIWSLKNPLESLNKIIYASSGQYAPTLLSVTSLAQKVVNKTRKSLGMPTLDPIKIVDPVVFDRFFLPMMKNRLPRNYQVVQQALDCFRPYLRIRTPRVFSDSDLAFQCISPIQALERCYAYWCQLNMIKDVNGLEETQSHQALKVS